MVEQRLKWRWRLEERKRIQERRKNERIRLRDAVLKEGGKSDGERGDARRSKGEWSAWEERPTHYPCYVMSCDTNSRFKSNANSPSFLPFLPSARFMSLYLSLPLTSTLSAFDLHFFYPARKHTSMSRFGNHLRPSAVVVSLSHSTS
jgi:hypothetical protein